MVDCNVALQIAAAVQLGWLAIYEITSTVAVVKSYQHDVLEADQFMQGV